LVYVGLLMLLQRRNVNLETGPAFESSGSGARRWLTRGPLCNVLNPKVGIFYITLLPQFILRGGSVAGYSFMFTSIHVAEGLLWLTLLTFAVGPLSSWLARPRVTRSLDCSTGAVLIGCGIALALERRR
jgi:threonine/homoserine/homoserine lactone efflux protein